MPGVGAPHPRDSPKEGTPRRALRAAPQHDIVAGVSDLRLLFIKLRRLLRSRGNNTDDADDLIQEAFLRLHIYCREHHVDKVEAFLVRTALNLSSDSHRHRQHSNAIAETLKTLGLAESFPSTDEVCSSHERVLHMKAGIDRLSPRRREVFVLNRIEGYSFSQIAERLGITLSAVEKHAAKATLLITDWMNGADQDSPGVEE
jgi:RNA polymerase sigma factor (sigma-70 family)